MKNISLELLKKIRKILLLMAVGMLCLAIVLSRFSILNKSQNNLKLDDRNSSLNANDNSSAQSEYQVDKDGQKPITNNNTPNDDDSDFRNNGDTNNPKIIEIITRIIVFLLILDLISIVVISDIIYIYKKENEIYDDIEYSRTESIFPDDLATNAGQQLIVRSKGASIVKVEYIHNIGDRPRQEDSLGFIELNDGIFAIVADGMGGLANGKKVSQKVVDSMVSFASKLSSGQMRDILPQMVNRTNRIINNMLGTSGLFKSGSTLVSVLVRSGKMYYVTVGDSRLYLYHDGQLIQLNQEHNRMQKLFIKAIKEHGDFDEVRNDPKRNNLTSFVGMGKLAFIEQNIYFIPIEIGDRLLLMSDGVYNALSDEQMEYIINSSDDISMIKDKMETSIKKAACPDQDNFTAIIIGF